MDFDWKKMLFVGLGVACVVLAIHIGLTYVFYSALDFGFTPLETSVCCFIMGAIVAVCYLEVTDYEWIGAAVIAVTIATGVSFVYSSAWDFFLLSYVINLGITLVTATCLLGGILYIKQRFF